LADRLSKKGTWTSAQVDAYVDAFFNVLHEGVTTEGVVKLKGLGTFKTIQVADRASVDVNTGERIVIPGHQKLKFVEEEKVNALLNNTEEAPAEPEETVQEEKPQLVKEETPQPAEEEKPQPVKEENPQPAEEEKLQPVKEEKPQPAEEVEPSVKEEELPKETPETAPAQPSSSVEPSPVQDVQDKGPRSKWWLWVLIALAVVLIVVGVVLAVNSSNAEVPSQEQKENAVPATPQKPIQPRYKIHSFQKGESLTTISVLYYGNPDSVDCIQQLNGLTDSSEIALGTELKMP
jgi:nucleoid DNA-binding protein